ncbi:MAG TPA: AAA family ATPase [Solirubrobacteraceae bacterium]|nr:AAA family ATPase [Solirubrobacteraceae bacterium]
MPTIPAPGTIPCCGIDPAGILAPPRACARRRIVTPASASHPPGSEPDAVRDALARPETYSHRPKIVEVRETHISWVFLAGELAYKLKKPLVLDFLDYGTAARRRELCAAEVRLNRRLAPDLYLGVRGVALVGKRVELIDENDPRAVDFVVEMRRYDEDRTLAARLDRGEVHRRDVVETGRVLARFHEDARRVAPGGAPVLAAERRFERNLHELLGDVDQRGEIERVQGLERFAHAFVTAHAHTFVTRSCGRHIREGHGDLRAEHVLLGDRVQIVDCVEFDSGLRELDVADDLAFLVFDLAARGADRLGEVLVDAYREAGGDPGPDSLIAFYAAYRALVRAKVALMRGAQLADASAEHGRRSAHARDLISVAERFAWRARQPLTIVVCGVPASGKSHLAQALAELSGLPHLSSDVIRKQFAGLGPTERAPGNSYTAGWNARTYAELGRRAADALTRNGGAIVDATFRHRGDRCEFTAALCPRSPVVFIECQAPRRILAERAARRERDPRHVSDASRAIVVREHSRWEPLDEVPANGHLTVRTDRPVEQIIADVLALLDGRLAELA